MQSEVLSVTTDTSDVCASMPVELRPLLGPELNRLIHVSPETLVALTRQYGSPLNIVVPQVLQRNAEALQDVCRRRDLPCEIFYGAKVNKSRGLIRAAVEAGIGVDVSSIHEMRDALRAGIDPRRLCATGPAKTRVFHMALVANEALISVDSVEELDDLESIAREIEPKRPIRILLRFRPEGAKSSRFGMSEDDIFLTLNRLAYLREIFLFEGFHFHLPGYRYDSRARAVSELVRFVDAASALGIDPRIIDIGGGLPARYVDPEAYEAFLSKQGGRDYRNGTVPASFYPYGGEIGACGWLDRFLAMPCVDGKSVVEYLKSRSLTLAIEPGRSLADQTAVSVFRVTRVKSVTDGEAVIFVEGSSFSACETWFASEFLVDPILVSTGIASTRDAMPVRAWIAGHSCLDEDAITNRLIHFPRRPKPGDLLVYANTAGYQMDLLESEFHRHPMPRRLAVRYDANGGMETSPDDRMEDRNDFE